MIGISRLTILCFILIFSSQSLANAKDDINKQNALTSNLRSIPGKAGEKVIYSFELINLQNTPQQFRLSIPKPEELACQTSLSDTLVNISPGGIYRGTFKVKVNERIPIGGQESCFLYAYSEELNRTYQLEFITVRARSHPFLLVTNEIIDEAKEKIKQYGWAKQNLNNLLLRLDDIQFPERKIITKPRPVKVWSSLAYNSSDGQKAFQLCLAWKLTGKTTYRDKAAHFIREVCDKQEGYLSIGAATTGVQVHEGNFFLFLAAACDLLYKDSVLTEMDRENIEATFRFYLKQNKDHMSSNGIMNHQASANAGAIIAALFMQDVAEVNYLIEAEGGLADQISKGVMADGWWFEGTANYCYLVTQRYVLVAQAFENYGWDLYHRRFPAKFKSKDFENIKEGFTGMKFENWGPTGKNTRGVEDMVSPYIPMMDENANVVSSNDSNLKEPNEYYELAYRKYKTKELAWVLSKSKRDSWISLMYGIAELPEVQDPRMGSAYVPNVGLVALRSQKANQKPEEQIQAYFKYGTHGGWHGHFDRTGMIALDRYGHKYFGTEMVWFGYGQPGYKECVQTSATHNMVVVDELQQEAVPSEQVLFHAGKIIQVSVSQTTARWRKIPTFNKSLFPPWDDKEFDPGFKPVLQRRLSIVIDEYVVIADYIKAPQKHTYDWLIHPIGFQSIEGAIKLGPLLDTVNTDYESPYKYFTNGQWYKLDEGARLQFDDNGALLDIHTIWPKKAEAIIAHYPTGGRQRGMRNNPDRRSYGIRVAGDEAHFLNILEPYQGNAMIEKIESATPSEFTVYLKDGREQRISICNMDGDGDDIQVQVEERMNKKLVRKESTKQ